ncbi:MAG: MFS transporter [Hyphomicrobiales bacterium]|nr:MAG: MFS transporter [Hyphomicrobiales bacterium]
MTAVSHADDHVDDVLARRNALILAVAQALGGANATIVFASAALVGHYLLGEDKSLATLPVTAYVLGMASSTIPVQLLSRWIGRRLTFMGGATLGIASGLMAAQAVFDGSFFRLCIATFVAGCYGGFTQAYRFAAADTASDVFRPKAISWVLIGGVAAAFLGPQIVIHTKDWFSPIMFAGSFLAQSCVAVVGVVVLFFLRIPKPHLAAGRSGGRPLTEIIAQSRFIVAVICGVTSYALMSFVMTAAPLAMVACHHSPDDAALGIQWHVLAMFAPSFFTGTLINRYGVEKVTATGLVLLAGCGVIALTGVEVAQFWAALVLLGVGWNFGFIGATTMVTQTYRLEERNKVQATNDFLIFGLQAVASFSSGKILANVGWDAINWAIFPFIVFALGALAWLVLFGQREAA